MKLSRLSIDITVESDEHYDFALIDAKIDGITGISRFDQWAVLYGVEGEIRAFLSGLSEQKHLTLFQYEFLARMSAAEFAIAAQSWDYDTKAWNFEKDCALSKMISYRAFFGGPMGPEQFMGIEDYILVNPATRVGWLIVRENESAEFREFFVNADDYISTWQETNEKLVPMCEARLRLNGR